jgi:hypothetical protein
VGRLRWIGSIATGLVAGAVATLLLVLLLVAARTWLGISPPPEAIPDRFAPTLDIPTFFGLFGRFGGYNGLKKLGVTSVLSGMAVVGLLIGVAYALLAGRGRTGGTDGERHDPRARRGLGFVAGAVAVLWLGTVVVLWPVLGANYRGLPPSSARILSIAGLLVVYAAYGVALVLALRRGRGLRPVIGDGRGEGGRPAGCETRRGRGGGRGGAGGDVVRADAPALRAGDVQLRRHALQRAGGAADRTERQVLHGDEERR